MASGHSGGIDLSVGSVIALSSVITAVWLRAELPIPIAVLGGLGAGVIVGVVNGLLVTSLSLAPFIVTLGTMEIARGLAKYYADEQTVNAQAGWLADLMTKTPDPEWLLVAKAEKYESEGEAEAEKRDKVRERLNELKDALSDLNREIRVIEAQMRRSAEESERLELQAYKLDFEAKK